MINCSRIYRIGGICSEYSYVFCDITRTCLIKRLYFYNGEKASARHRFLSWTNDSDVFALNCIVNDSLTHVTNTPIYFLQQFRRAHPSLMTGRSSFDGRVSCIHEGSLRGKTRSKSLRQFPCNSDHFFAKSM